MGGVDEGSICIKIKISTIAKHLGSLNKKHHLQIVCGVNTAAKVDHH